MSFVVFAWITSLLYSASGLVGKFAANHKITNPWLYNMIWSLVIGVVSCSAALYVGIDPVRDWQSILVAGFMSAVTAATYVFAVYLLDISILAPLYMLRTPISAVLGFLWFGEGMTYFQIGIIIIMTIAGMFVSIDERMHIKSFFKKTIAFGLVTILLSAIYNANVRIAVERNDYWTTVFWYNLLSPVFLLVTVPLFWKEIKNVNIVQYGYVSLSGILAAVGGLTAIYATLGNLGISMAILNLPLSMIIVMVLSFVMPTLLESHSPKVYAVRFTAALVMFIGALLLST